MNVFIDNIDVFWAGLLMTLKLAGASVALALPAGVLIAAARVSPVAGLRHAGSIYVEFIRNTPLTVVFFFVVFVLPQLDIHFSFFGFAILSLVIYYSAFFCEAVRSGINAVALGQAEAARSIGLTFTQTLSAVILPQALRTAVPPLVNVAIALVKNTAVASAFGVAELLSAMEVLTNRQSDHVIAVLVISALIYLVLTVPLGLLASALERRSTFAR